jgi:ribosome maturation factor RimP
VVQRGPRPTLLFGFAVVQEEVVDLNVSSHVRDLVEPLLAGAGVELVDVEHTGATLRVVVDRPGGIDLDTISELTEMVSSALDQADPIPGRYSLEVSSPGIERPLRTPEHFRRFVGHAVTVRTRPGLPLPRRLDGTLEAADDTGIAVAVDGEEHRLAYDDVERARTRFVWERGPKPGRSVRGARRKARTA